MSFHLVCNYKNCLKSILSAGWATACSHIFCEKHGASLKMHWKSTACPACGSRFESEFSIVETQTNPSEEYKSMALSGLRPDIVLQIASNAIAFWAYQCNQEMKIQRNKFEYYKSKLASMKSEIEHNKVSYEKLTHKLQTKLSEASNKIKQLTFESLEKDRKISSLERAQSNNRRNMSFN